MSSICNDLSKLFERELRRRLETRSNKYASESMLLHSAFKFSDNLNTGYINKTQWIKAFEKIGLTGFSDQDLSFLFDYYDNNQTGLINYKQFSLFLLNPNNLFTPNIPLSPISIHYQTKQYFNQLLESFRNKINVQGGLLYYLLLERMFKASYRMIHFDILLNCFRDLNIPTGIRDLKDFFALIDANDSRWIGIEQMMRMIRGKMGLNRGSALQKCYDMIDQGKKQLIGIDELMQCFSSRNDIEVRYGRANEKEVHERFQLMIGIFCSWKSVKMISIDDFIEFYEPISASIESDNYFIEMIESNWLYDPFSFENDEKKDERNIHNSNKSINHYDNNPNSNIRNYERDKESTPVNSSSDKPDLYQIPTSYFKSSVDDLNNQRHISEYNRFNQNKLKRIPILNNTPRIKQFRSNNDIYSNSQRNQLQENPLSKSLYYSVRDNQTKPQNVILTPNLIERSPSCYQQFLNQKPKTKDSNDHNTILPPIYQTPLINKSQSQPLMNSIPLYAQQNTHLYHQNKSNLPSRTLNTLLRELANQVIKKLHLLLSSRGEKGIFGFLRMLVFYDRNYSRRISLLDLSTLIQSYRLNLNQEEIEALFSHYTIDNSGLMSYETFINDLIGEMNQKRQSLIRQVFSQLDKQNLGYLNIDDIKADYNPSRHPDVIDGKKPSEEILGEWLDNIEAFCMYNNLSISNRSIFIDEFVKFYSLISFSIAEDRYFDYIVYNVWNIAYQQYQKRRKINWS